MSWAATAGGPTMATRTRCGVGSWKARADLADDVDVQRLFAESNAAFAGVDVVVHTTSGSASLLYQHAARRIRQRGAIVSTLAADRVTPGVARQLDERGISIGRAPPEDVLAYLDRWRKQTIA